LPELPEVETTLKGIRPWLVGQQIEVVNVFNHAMRWPIPTAVYDLVGQQICEVRRRAKYLLIQLSNHSHLILHLGMSGVIRVLEHDEVYAKHDHFELILNNGKSLRLNDPRRFGCVLLADDKDINQHPLLSQLGPEPLSETFDGRWLKQLAKNRKVAVKNFIMNNHTVVGVGNIYAAESLFLAGIRPDKKASSISLKKYHELADVIKKVLSRAIAVGGTTLKDFKDAEGKPGYFKQALNVYGRAGEVCVQCDATINNIIIGQRASCYCPNCQK